MLRGFIGPIFETLQKKAARYIPKNWNSSLAGLNVFDSVDIQSIFIGV